MQPENIEGKEVVQAVNNILCYFSEFLNMYVIKFITGSDFFLS